MDMYDVFKTLKARGYVVNTCPIYPDDPEYGARLFRAAIRSFLSIVW